MRVGKQKGFVVSGDMCLGNNTLHGGGTDRKNLCLPATCAWANTPLRPPVWGRPAACPARSGLLFSSKLRGNFDENKAPLFPKQRGFSFVTWDPCRSDLQKQKIHAFQRGHKSQSGMLPLTDNGFAFAENQVVHINAGESIYHVCCHFLSFSIYKFIIARFHQMASEQFVKFP